MTIDTLKRILIFLTLCLSQALVLNRIQLFHCATPLLYVYFVIAFPRSFPKWAALLWSFSMGFIIDVFSNTPGVATASLTLLGLLQPYLLELFLPRNAEEDIHSSAASLGWANFVKLSSLLVVIYCFTFFSLEAFNFFNWMQWLAFAAGSSVLTLLFIITLESVRK
jgi:rod shape-determining protein MreD